MKLMIDEVGPIDVVKRLDLLLTRWELVELLASLTNLEKVSRKEGEFYSCKIPNEETDRR